VQCEGLPASIVDGKPARVRNPDTRDTIADEFLASIGVDIREGQGEAYYAPGQDFISLPAFGAFRGADHFYNVAFHELAHWTGHKARLDRELKGRLGQAAYAAEELIAELGAAFLAAEFSFDGDVRHAGYIETWIGLLRSDKHCADLGLMYASVSLSHFGSFVVGVRACKCSCVQSPLAGSAVSALGRTCDRLCQRQPSQIVRRRLRLTRRSEERALVAAQ
jgi:antirestriction protein ArdC